MTNKIIARSAFALLALAFACNGREMTVGSGPEGSGPEPSTPTGDQPRQVWSGYVERYKFRSGSDRITVTFDSATSGTVVLGEPPAAGEVMDPNVTYPPDCNLPPFGDMSPGDHLHTFEECAERHAFTMRRAIKEERRLRFEVDVFDKWQPWCAAQKPYADSWTTGSGGEGDASTVPWHFSCGVPLPAGEVGQCQVCNVPEEGAGCPEEEVGWVDCKTRSICISACECTATECSSRSAGSPHIRFDLNVQGNEAHGTSELGQVHLVLQ